MVAHQDSRTAGHIFGTCHSDRPLEIQQPHEEDRDPISNGATWSPYSGAGVELPSALHQLGKTILVGIFHAAIIYAKASDRSRSIGTAAGATTLDLDSLASIEKFVRP